MRPSELATRPIEALIPYAGNSRTHSDAQVAQVEASMLEFGWTIPVLIDPEGGIIAGHGRVMAAARVYARGETINGLDGKPLPRGDAPVLVAHGWSDAQRRAYVIADNKLAANAGWDEDALRAEIEALGTEDFDLGILGFDDDELAGILADKTDGLVDPDETPEPPEQPITVLGDVWLMGGHRIICGDSTKAEDVARALNGAKPHLMVTDPPYGVNYDADWRNHTGDLNRSGRAVGKVENDDRADWSEAWALFSGDVAYVWHAGNMAHTVAESLISNGLHIRAQIIWNKSNMVIGRGDYHPKHEPCWYAVRKGKPGHYVGGRKQTTVWDINKPQKSETGHSTQKPVECMKRPIENNSKPGDAVYEPFSGSGTTIIAGEMTGRHVHAIELNPAYVDVAVRRWEDFTGRAAMLESTGQSFREVSDERRLAAKAA